MLIGRFGFDQNESSKLAKAFDRVNSEKCHTFFKDEVRDIEFLPSSSDCQLRSAYTDGFFANALNAILVRQGKDTKKTFSDRTEAEVQRASMYWHQRQFEVCKMRYE